MTDSRGFALLEWLIASAFVLIIAGTLFGTLAPVRDIVERSNQGTDLVTSARNALDLITADLREAGSDAAVGQSGVVVTLVVPPLRLVESLDADVDAQPAAAVVINRVPDLAAQGRLRLAAAAGEQLLRLETSARCSSGALACGFREGDRAAVLTDVAGEELAVIETLADAVVLAAPLANAYPVGAVLTRFSRIGYGLRAGPDGVDRLVRVSDSGVEQPLLDNVVEFAVSADDPDPIRIRRISLRLRVQTPSAAFRGPAGFLFRQAGTASTSRRWLPDVEMRTDVARRNPGVAW
jgi:hypothetical protein